MLKSILSSATQAVGLGQLPSGFGYVLGEPVGRCGPWEMLAGTAKAGGQVSVFLCSKKTRSAEEQAHAQNALKRLKTLRHTHILKVLDSCETDAGLYVVTEKVVSLPDFAKEAAHASEEPAFPAWGVFQVLDALAFLHTSGLEHGSLDPACVWVADGDFRLWGFEATGPPGTSRHDKARLTASRFPAWPSESRAGDAADARNLAQYCLAAFTRGSRPEQLEAAPALPTAFARAFRDLATARDHAFLREDPSVRVMQRLEGLALLEDAEKALVLEQLPAEMAEVPASLRQQQILRQLLRTAKQGLAAQVLPPLLAIAGDLPAARFEAEVQPEILRLFGLQDRAVRHRLLQGMPRYAHFLSEQVLESAILPQLAAGFTDSHAAVREMTVKSVVQFAAKLKPATLEGKVAKPMQRLLQDSEASIRANTLICFGMIGQHLPARDGVVAALAVGLKDPFPPCRLCSLKAIADTADLYGAEDLAVKLLPHVVQRLVDPDASVAATAPAVVQKLSARAAELHATALLNLQREAAEKEANATGKEASKEEAGEKEAQGWGSWAASAAARGVAAGATLAYDKVKTRMNAEDEAAARSASGTYTTPAPPAPAAPAAPAAPREQPPAAPREQPKGAWEEDDLDALFADDIAVSSVQPPAKGMQLKSPARVSGLVRAEEPKAAAKPRAPGSVERANGVKPEAKSNGLALPRATGSTELKGLSAKPAPLTKGPVRATKTGTGVALSSGVAKKEEPVSRPWNDDDIDWDNL